MRFTFVAIGVLVIVGFVLPIPKRAFARPFSPKEKIGDQQIYKYADYDYTIKCINKYGPEQLVKRQGRRPPALGNKAVLEPSDFKLLGKALNPLVQLAVKQAGIKGWKAAKMHASSLTLYESVIGEVIAAYRRIAPNIVGVAECGTPKNTGHDLSLRTTFWFATAVTHPKNATRLSQWFLSFGPRGKDFDGVLMFVATALTLAGVPYDYCKLLAAYKKLVTKKK